VPWPDSMLLLHLLVVGLCRSHEAEAGGHRRAQLVARQDQALQVLTSPYP
jgi:hypothetical protein